MDSGGPKESCITWVPRSPGGGGNFVGASCNEAFRCNSLTTFSFICM